MVGRRPCAAYRATMSWRRPSAAKKTAPSRRRCGAAPVPTGGRRDGREHGGAQRARAGQQEQRAGGDGRPDVTGITSRRTGHTAVGGCAGVHRRGSRRRRGALAPPGRATGTRADLGGAEPGSAREAARDASSSLGDRSTAAVGMVAVSAGRGTGTALRGARTRRRPSGRARRHAESRTRRRGRRALVALSRWPAWPPR